MKHKSRLFIPFCLLIFVWAFIINVLIVSFAPYNPLTPSKSFRLNLGVLAPQGWGFFTRDPREPNLYIYTKTKNNKLSLYEPQKNSSSVNFYGISRNARSISLELSEILKKVDTSLWSKSSRIDINNQYKSSKMIPVINFSSNPILKDTIFIVCREKTPWAWIKSYDEVKMPSKTIKLYVTLPKKTK